MVPGPLVSFPVQGRTRSEGRTSLTHLREFQDGLVLLFGCVGVEDDVVNSLDELQLYHTLDNEGLE